MPEKISFASMIESFGVLIQVDAKVVPGYYERGDWVPATTQPVYALGVLLPFGTMNAAGDEIRYSEAGTHKTKNRKLITLVSLKLGQTIVYKGNRYTVQEFDDFTDYTDVNMYVARWTGNEGG
ncbi:hypothetical protein AWH48_12045 [Domibacillus aminovorans]|uniref:Uncharacterized protein n=1 Tax=Domibacillus aminovorans TaxID=29332 RepID=A0A177KI53_9BACI|nr:hypothetical protein [Domibacillus aminovorans]OAH53083.1 hypothetical protein AWH48_12045 [Domibacillus aminovorans]